MKKSYLQTQACKSKYTIGTGDDRKIPRQTSTGFGPVNTTKSLSFCVVESPPDKILERINNGRPAKVKKAAGKLSEGAIKKGGMKPKPSTPKPDVKPAGQNPSPQKTNSKDD